MTVDSCTYGHRAVFISKMDACFDCKSRGAFNSTLIISVPPFQVSNLRLQSCLDTITQCDIMRNLLVGKIAFNHNWWRIPSQFPSPPCGFCQIKSFYTCFLVQYSPHPSAQPSISTAATMSFCRLHDRTGFQVWMMELGHCPLATRQTFK